ncbi:Uncharacterised protein [Mycobacteroides abscessus subsp. abscessus]|nr:Uncharacterised protein [Mycobacteroides abscessus subsp. abscessus]
MALSFFGLLCLPLKLGNSHFCQMMTHNRRNIANVLLQKPFECESNFRTLNIAALIGEKKFDMGRCLRINNCRLAK